MLAFGAFMAVWT